MKERTAKLLRLALDPKAKPGEADNAGLAFIRAARKEGVTFDDLHGNGHTRTEYVEVKSDEPPVVANCTMTFGKYRHRTLYWIATSDPGYLQWLHKEATMCSRGLKAAIAIVYRWAFEDDT